MGLFENHINSRFAGWENDERRKMSREYCLSTNSRADQTIREISKFTTIRDKRVLDIGTAYAGIPVVSMLAGAREAIGIDISEDFISVGKLNVEDHKSEAKIIHMSIFDEEIESLGGFDIIVCNDVIEHVDEPRKAIEIMSKLLNPGGYIYMQIPNHFALSHLIADGHYLLFGITLLPYQFAKEYYYGTPKYKNEQYTVAYWKSYAFYKNYFQKNGINLNLLDKFDSSFYPDFLKSKEEFRKKLSACTIERITRRGNKLLEIIDKETDHQYLYNYYYLSFWKFIGHRPLEKRKSFFNFLNFFSGK